MARDAGPWVMLGIGVLGAAVSAIAYLKLADAKRVAEATHGPQRWQDWLNPFAAGSAALGDIAADFDVRFWNAVFWGSILLTVALEAYLMWYFYVITPERAERYGMAGIAATGQVASAAVPLAVG